MNPYADLPFAMARLDGKGRILHATEAFAQVFKLTEPLEGQAADALLPRHLRVDLPALEGEGDSRGRVGFVLSVPEGHFPGTPFYISRVPAPGSKEDSFLFLGDISRMNSVQALAIAHSGLLGALFETLNEQVCLLEEDGGIIWTDESCRELLGKNIFSLSKPEKTARPGGVGQWNGAFLAGLDTSTRVQAMLAIAGTLIPYTLVFSPLDGADGRQYLLLLHPPAQEKSGETKASVQPLRPTRSRDSLTDLYGYSQFHTLLKHAADEARKHEFQIGVAFCDIEGLHKFNALHGCRKGDIMLRRVAGCLAESCRPGLDHACRYGADKFAVIISKAARPLMDSLAEGIQGQVRERCDAAIQLNIGLVLIAPSETPKDRLDAARSASGKAAALPGRVCWAQ
jgi:diguanylate cyclase (GGDEF)-like protein